MRKSIFIFIALLIAILFHDAYSYNPDHLRIFFAKKPHHYWEQWRKKNPSIKPDLSNALIENYSFGINFVDIKLKNANFRSVSFRNSKIINCTINQSDFNNADFSYSVILNCKVPGPHSVRFLPDFTKASFYSAKIISTRFYEGIFVQVNFIKAYINNSKFEYSVLKHTKFVSSIIINTEFSNNYSGIDFFDNDFAFAKLKNVRILSLPFFKNRIRNIKFNSAVLHKCTFMGFLDGISFINADLSDTSFFYATIPEKTILNNVNFTNSNLTNVNFQKAKFQNVIFKNADMTGAKLERKWYSYVKKQGVRNFDKINWQ